jgi:short-subunit dehydrogenase
VRCGALQLYGATKAFLTEWAISLAPELRSEGIDVGVILPSPVASNFYTAEGINHQIDAMEFFKQQATGPEVIADVLCRNLGRAVVIDQGWYPLTVRALVRPNAPRDSAPPYLLPQLYNF